MSNVYDYDKDEGDGLGDTHNPRSLLGLLWLCGKLPSVGDIYISPYPRPPPSDASHIKCMDGQELCLRVIMKLTHLT